MELNSREETSFRPVFPRGALIGLIALLVAETTINYLDRQALSVLAPVLRDEFHLSNTEYASIINAFMVVYTVSYAVAGWVMDRLGVVRGLTLAVTWWSAAGALTALARGPVTLAVCRSLLAVGSGGAWPSFAKAVALWVPPQGRALAIGVCNSGSSLGSLLTPPLAAFLALKLGWRAAFAVIGAIGLLWVAAFLGFARLHPGLLATDRGHPAQHSGRPQVRWLSLMRYRQTWAVFFCRFFADSAWYFYVYWIPEFLARERGLNLAAIGAVAGLPFLVSTVSNFATGYAALRLQRAGWSVNRARKTLMFVGMALSSVGITAVFAHSLFWTMTLLSLGVFFWMCWSATVHTLPGEFFPPHAVASVYGFGGTGSTLGSVISTWAVGRTLDLTGSYVPVFIGIGLLTPVAFVGGTALMGRVEPVRMVSAAAPSA